MAARSRQIAARLPDHGYKFSGLVLEIVNSLPFTSRRLPLPEKGAGTAVTAAGDR